MWGASQLALPRVTRESKLLSFTRAGSDLDVTVPIGAGYKPSEALWGGPGVAIKSEKPELHRFL